jgi:hypothetical protein
MCNHTDKNECQCACHIPTESGEPMIIHMISCCEKCEECGRNVDYQVAGFTS